MFLKNGYFSVITLKIRAKPAKSAESVYFGLWKIPANPIYFLKTVRFLSSNTI